MGSTSPIYQYVLPGCSKRLRGGAKWNALELGILLRSYVRKVLVPLLVLCLRNNSYFDNRFSDASLPRDIESFYHSLVSEVFPRAGAVALGWKGMRTFADSGVLGYLHPELRIGN